MGPTPSMWRRSSREAVIRELRDLKCWARSLEPCWPTFSMPRPWMRRQRGWFLLSSIDWTRFLADFSANFSRGMS